MLNLALWLFELLVWLFVLLLSYLFQSVCDGNLNIKNCFCRLLILLRLVALGFFLTWRIRHPNRDAMWLWGMSTVCELWFAFSWILDQLPKLCPANTSHPLLAEPPRRRTLSTITTSWYR
jgi:hypothetical protein